MDSPLVERADGAYGQEPTATISPGQDPSPSDRAEPDFEPSSSQAAQDPPQTDKTEEVHGRQPHTRISPGQTGNDSSQAPVKEPETKYVLSGQPTGWTAMSKEVREFDEEKVKSCKEDVDTLLVFAGLFSAVLSAFLVAAYPNLQPSPMTIISYNLERIANQTVSYNFTDGKLIATTISPLSPPPFAISDEDIRVNVLWFASLILSLMTASFGMLVKQWLREFLAVENPSPQARLRIRHFREPQLQSWMVYEIVACLPLLLQLSLGLFFVGLCYFTSSIHSSVGHTTFPLVVGWALCFFGATALPIFFPRCPYRTTLLKAIIASLHRQLHRFAGQIKLKNETGNGCSFRALYEHLRMLTTGISTWLRARTALIRRSLAQHPILILLLPLLPVLYMITYTRHVVYRYLEQRLLAYLQDASVRLANILQPPPVTQQARSIILQPLSIQWWYTRYAAVYNASIKALRGLEDTDEQLLVGNSASDVELLASVDAIQANDELLGTTIAEALHYMRPRWDEVYNFLIQVISHRVPVVPPSERVIPGWPFRDCRPLEQLRPQATESIMRILHEYIQMLYSRHMSIHSGRSTLDLAWLREILLLISVLRVNHRNNSDSNAPTITKLIAAQSPAMKCLQWGLDCMYNESRRHQEFVSCILPGDIIGNALLRLRILTDALELFRTDIVKGDRFYRLIWSEFRAAVAVHHDRDWHPQSPFSITLSIEVSNDGADKIIRRAWDVGFLQASMEYLRALLSHELVSLQDSQPWEVWSCTASISFMDTFETAICLCSSDRLLRQSTPEQGRKLGTPLIHVMALSVKHKWSTDMLLDICKKLVRQGELNLLVACRSALHQGFELTAPITKEDLSNFSSCMAERLSQPGIKLLRALDLCHIAILLCLLVDARSAGVEDCREVFARITSTILYCRNRLFDARIFSQELRKWAGRQAYKCLEIMESERNWRNIDSIFPDALIEVLGEFARFYKREGLDRLQALERRRGTPDAEATPHEAADPNSHTVDELAEGRGGEPEASVRGVSGLGTENEENKGDEDKLGVAVEEHIDVVDEAVDEGNGQKVITPVGTTDGGGVVGI